jgi:hypothetical protein
VQPATALRGPAPQAAQAHVDNQHVRMHRPGCGDGDRGGSPQRSAAGRGGWDASVLMHMSELESAARLGVKLQPAVVRRRRVTRYQLSAITNPLVFAFSNARCMIPPCGGRPSLVHIVA